MPVRGAIILAMSVNIYIYIYLFIIKIKLTFFLKPINLKHKKYVCSLPNLKRITLNKFKAL